MFAALPFLLSAALVQAAPISTSSVRASTGLTVDSTGSFLTPTRFGSIASIDPNRGAGSFINLSTGQLGASVFAQPHLNGVFSLPRTSTQSDDSWNCTSNCGATINLNLIFNISGTSSTVPSNNFAFYDIRYEYQIAGHTFVFSYFNDNGDIPDQVARFDGVPLPATWGNGGAFSLAATLPVTISCAGGVCGSGVFDDFLKVTARINDGLGFADFIESSNSFNVTLESDSVLSSTGGRFSQPLNGSTPVPEPSSLLLLGGALLGLLGISRRRAFASVKNAGSTQALAGA